MIRTAQTDGRWEFRPCLAQVQGCVMMAAVSPVVSLLVAITGFSDGYVVGGALFLILTAALVATVIWLWLLRETPLIVEVSGRITYREYEVCAAGTVRAVVIVRDDRDTDSPSVFWVGLLTAGDNIVKLPGPFFHESHEDRDPVSHVAAELSNALKVEVVDRVLGP